MSVTLLISTGVQANKYIKLTATWSMELFSGIYFTFCFHLICENYVYRAQTAITGNKPFYQKTVLIFLNNFSFKALYKNCFDLLFNTSATLYIFWLEFISRATCTFRLLSSVLNLKDTFVFKFIQNVLLCSTRSNTLLPSDLNTYKIMSFVPRSVNIFTYNKMIHVHVF